MRFPCKTFYSPFKLFGQTRRDLISFLTSFLLKIRQKCQCLQTSVHNLNLNSLRMLQPQHAPVFSTLRHPITSLLCLEQVPQLQQAPFRHLGLPRWARPHCWVQAPQALVLVARLPIRSPVLWALRDLRIFLDT